jgi:two-component system chemotaxis response regulator CheY
MEEIMSEKSVIIIDDSKYIIGLLERFFVEQLHFKVVATALDGTDALDLYRRLKPDLLTLDLSMPNKDGKDVLKELLNEFPDANILIISAIRGDAIMQCLSMGAKGYIEKPLRFTNADFVADFIESVNEAVGTSGPPK